MPMRDDITEDSTLRLTWSGGIERGEKFHAVFDLPRGIGSRTLYRL